MKEYINLFRDCSGIYCIENIKNEKKYIGQAVNLKRRIEAHLYRLRGGYEVGRKILKSVSEEYLLRKNGTEFK